MLICSYANMLTLHQHDRAAGIPPCTKKTNKTQAVQSLASKIRSTEEQTQRQMDDSSPQQEINDTYAKNLSDRELIDLGP